MKRYLFLILLFPLLFSCSKEQKVCCTVLGATQHFRVVNANGEDLLNPDTDNAIDVSKINIYFLVDGEKVEARDYYRQHQPNSPSAYNRPYNISEFNDEYTLTVQLNDSIREDGAITYTLIEWDEDDVDTIKGVSTVRGSNFFVTDMIQFNDIEVPPGETGKIFTIVK